MRPFIFGETWSRVMPDIKILESLFVYFGIPVGTIFILILIICLALWTYPRFKLFIGDLLKVFGKTSKWIRRKSIETEFEGSINIFTKQFNSELSITLLPECTIQWVTPKNVKSHITPGKAILRLSFGEDHELNFYNTASAFIDISLIPRTKPFLSKMASRAIDLLMMKNLLTRNRRQVLNIFNNKFRDEDREVKERFFQCEETDRKGLFKRILLQEYHFWGEAMGEKTPNESHYL